MSNHLLFFSYSSQFCPDCLFYIPSYLYCLAIVLIQCNKWLLTECIFLLFCWLVRLNSNSAMVTSVDETRKCSLWTERSDFSNRGVDLEIWAMPNLRSQEETISEWAQSIGKGNSTVGLSLLRAQSTFFFTAIWFFEPVTMFRTPSFNWLLYMILWGFHPSRN